MKWLSCWMNQKKYTVRDLIEILSNRYNICAISHIRCLNFHLFNKDNNNLEKVIFPILLFFTPSTEIISIFKEEETESFTASILSLSVSVEDDGKDLVCRADNTRFPGGSAEDRRQIHVACKSLNLTPFRFSHCTYSFPWRFLGLVLDLDTLVERLSRINCIPLGKDFIFQISLRGNAILLRRNESFAWKGKPSENAGQLIKLYSFYIFYGKSWEYITCSRDFCLRFFFLDRLWTNLGSLKYVTPKSISQLRFLKFKFGRFQKKILIDIHVNN